MNNHTKAIIALTITGSAAVMPLRATAVYAGPQTKVQTAMKEIIKTARDAGLAEDSPIIVESKRVWMDEQKIKIDRAKSAEYEVPADPPETPDPEPTPEPVPTTSEPELVYIGNYSVTGYDTCYQCCGKTDGITASGTTATVGYTIATGTEFAFGTELYIEGIGYRTVEDRGPGNGRIDVLCNNHTDCYAITGNYAVYKVVR